MLWLNIELATCHSQLSCRPLSVTMSLPHCLTRTNFHTLTCTVSIFTSFRLICLIFGLLGSPLPLLSPPSCSWLSPVGNTDLCNNMSGVVVEMLSRPGEDGFPDLVTVMRNLSTDSGMPTLPPGGGLASK